MVGVTAVYTSPLNPGWWSDVAWVVYLDSES